MKIDQIDNEYTILKILKDNPQMTQRQLSKELGLSLGKTNFLIHALMSKGLVKLDNFRHSNNKLGYLYLITPKGVEEKSILAKNFLERKSVQYNKLKKEIEILKSEQSEQSEQSEL